MKPAIKIYAVDNGWIVKSDEGVYLFEESKSEHETFADMLRHITQQIGPSDSRYCDKRIYVVIKPGDKYE